MKMRLLTLLVLLLLFIIPGCGDDSGVTVNTNTTTTIPTPVPVGASTVQGTVYGTDGQPVGAGITVRLTPNITEVTGSENYGEQQTTTTDAQGGFSFTVHYTGTYLIDALNGTQLLGSQLFNIKYTAWSGHGKTDGNHCACRCRGRCYSFFRRRHYNFGVYRYGLPDRSIYILSSPRTLYDKCYSYRL